MIRSLYALLPAGLLLAACNNPLTNQPITPQTIAANVVSFCQSEGALAVVIAQDGTVLQATPGQQSAIATGSQLVALNCAALVAFLGTAPVVGAPVAEVDTWVRKGAVKLHISQYQAYRIAHHYHYLRP
jgi:hypothetical protein